MTEEENEILNFIAIVPNNTDFEKGNFYDVRSPNPEDMAQEIVKQLPKKNVITVASFGPQTVTSHSYLVGQVSILDSLLHSFADAKIEVKVVLKNSSKRCPSDSNYYSINNNKQIDRLAKKIRTMPDSDYIKVYLYIQKYTIILLSLPPFLPFSSRATKKIIANGWKILMNPSELIHTRALALLHIDPNLPTESSALKFLPNENRMIEVDENEIENLGQAVQIQIDEDELKAQKANEQQQQIEENQNQEENIGVDNQNSEVLHEDNKSSASMNSRNNQYDRNVPVEEENEQNQSFNSKYDEENHQNSIQNGQVIEEEEEVVDDVSSTTKQQQNNQQENINNQKSKQPIDVKQFIDIEGQQNESEQLEHEEDVNIHEEEETKEEESSIEVQIQKFVSKLQLNIPVLADPSVFSTLFQQLFYERWKSSILSQYRSQLSTLRDQIKERSSEEISSLKQLVNSKDMTLLLQREEERMCALEAKTIDTLEQVIEKRLQRFADVSQKSYLKSFQTICGDYITLQKQIRNKRAETRSLIMQIRIHQLERMKKLQEYHQKVEELENIASSQTRLEKAEQELDQIRKDNKKLEADRAALIKQRAKVRAMLDKKQKISKV